jgi:UPF0755 protein
LSDELDLFADYSDDPPLLTRRQRRLEEEFARRRRKHRTVSALAGLCVLLLVGAGVVVAGLQMVGLGYYPDYSGSGSGQVVIEVKSGDLTSEIGETLEKQGVVASVEAFTRAAAKEPKASDIEPGFYLMRKQMSGESAVDMIVSPSSRVGEVQVRGGMRLDDTNGVTPQPGILTLLARASCIKSTPQLSCTTPAQMQAVAAQSDLASLGVPSWAIGPASAVQPPTHRLEGLILPGVYEVKPGESPQDILRSVIQQSAKQMELAGLPQAASGSSLTPYQLLTEASLVQSEGIEQDFPKIARVITDRLQQHIPLQLDSTINYLLDQPTLLTSPADRARPGPYNTYLDQGLPPTPISSASTQAIVAAVNPAPGNWLYFVKCFPNGASCFESTQAQHDADIRTAQQNGAY